MKRNQKVDINKLQFDLENPRLFQNAKNQEEAFKKMIDLQKEKVFKLAEDIAETKTVNETFIVMKKNKQYITLDGNRRLAAIKLLTTSKNQLSELLPDYKIQIQKLPSLSYEDFDVSFDLYTEKEKESAFDHIEKRHQGELLGVGQVKWGSSEKSRFAKRREKTPHIGYRILEQLEEKEKELSSTLKDQTTTIQRIFEDLWIKESIFHLKRGIEIDINHPTNFNKIIEMLKFFKDENATVADVYDRKKRQEFFKFIEPIEEDSKQLLLPIEDSDNEQQNNNSKGIEKNKQYVEDTHSTNTKDSTTHQSYTSHDNETIANTQTKSEDKDEVTPKRNTKQPKYYKYLDSAFPANKNFEKNQKLNQAFRELSRLDYKACPISALLLIRSILETYTHIYVNEFSNKDKQDPLVLKGAPKNISSKPINTLLKDYIAPHLKNKFQCQDISNKIELVTSKQNESMPVTQVLNYYVHTNQTYPSPEVILNAWKDISVITNKLDEILDQYTGQ